MPEAFHQAVCPEHEYKGEAVQRRAFAQIQADVHGQNKTGCDAAYVREFEAESVGSLPRKVPPADFEPDEEVSTA